MIFLFAVLLSAGTAWAVPAHKGTVKVQQPDGSVLELRLVGDEWLHFNTTADGYSVVKNDKGFYVYAELKNGKLQPTKQVAHDEVARSASERAFLSGVKKYQHAAMDSRKATEKKQSDQSSAKALAAKKAGQYDYNNFRGLMILVQFNDKSFSRSDYKDIMTNMVNQPNYTGYTATNGSKVNFVGSVRDYYEDNSMGQFKPEFDIYGPFTIPYSQYDGHDYAKVVYAAIEAADASVNFKNYDRDNDGVVDMIYFIFAGNGANYGGNDSRLYWPLRSVVYNPSNYGYVYKDNVLLYDYASSVELAGYTYYPNTVTIDGIGTICHEFSHVLGLPDFYDTDYERSGGESHDPGYWSVMAGGSYNNNGRQPVGYSMFERYMIGFAQPETINSSGSYSLQNIQTSNTGYRINSSVNKEYFMLENRQKDNKWNAYLPGHGLLVFRVDSTNTSVWNNNTINVNPAHNYYELVRANGWRNSDSDSDPFPGTARVTTLNNITMPASLKTWAGKDTQWGLKNIQENNGIITFDIEDTYVLRGISIDEEVAVAVGTAHQLEVTFEPDYLSAEIKWQTSDATIATVDANGLVSGVKAGECTITATTADNAFSATCKVVVENVTEIPTIAEFLQQKEGSKVKLQFADAQVLYAYNNDIYVRDATGAIVLRGTGITPMVSDVLKGSVYVEYTTENEMPVAQMVDGSAVATGLTVSAGDEVLPRIVSFEDLMATDYADYVMIENVTLERSNGVWAISGSNRARLFNKFQIKGISVPTNITDKIFRIPAIYGTDVLNGAVIPEIYLLGSPEEYVPSGIDVFNFNAGSDADLPTYNLAGQRVGKNYKGIVIRGGRKVLQK